MFAIEVYNPYLGIILYLCPALRNLSRDYWLALPIG